MSDTAALLRTLIDDPENEVLLHQAADRLNADPDDFGRAAEDVLPPPKESVEIAFFRPNVWSNCIGNETCTASSIRYPKSRQELVQAVATARKEGKALRAVGSGHSFSDVALTDGILLDPHWMKKVLTVDRSVLKESAAKLPLFSVESGITIKDLNDALDKAELALINMGAYNGQTLAGAISTGTHGTGASLGPLSSSVRSLVLVSETGTIYQIEPSNGITDPAKFASQYHDVILKQDDDWFQSNVVAMGCMGVIYSYTLEVMCAYDLLEERTATTWEALRPQLLGAPAGELPPIITQYRHFEIDLNPYEVDGAHTCVVTTRKEHKGRSGHRSLANWISGFLAGRTIFQWAVVQYINHVPTFIPRAVDMALKTLVESEYADKSYKVLDLGAVNNAPACAIEFAFDAAHVVPAIDKLLALLAEQRRAKLLLMGPIGIRFVSPADAYLAPQYGRPTCTTELDMLWGINWATKLLQHIETEIMHDNGVRVHWGLDMDMLDGSQIRAAYPQFDRWLAVYRELNSSGMFNNKFTERLGISTVSTA